uniref:Uncharacterized protein n=1 Tax=Heterorhabditis bacteriophora TaxID=37862 RepID=A0A1I7WIC0_HETBA
MLKLQLIFKCNYFPDTFIKKLGRDFILTLI